MNEYPNDHYVKGHVTKEQLKDQRDNLSFENAHEKVLEFNGEMDSVTASAYVELFAAITLQFPEATMTGSTIWRPKTKQEMREAVFSSLKQDMYYHPDKYGIPEEEWA
jgi:hypothetical protein